MTVMAEEIAAIPEAVARQIDAGLADYAAMGRTLAATDPVCVVTCARGSSDHATLYFKYLVEIGCGIPVASVGPSVASVYGAALGGPRIPVVAVSQSGGSPDLAAFVAASVQARAPTFALVNTDGSPLALAAEHVLALHAGPERAVAATKSFVCSLVALAAITAAWRDDDGLTDAIRALPDTLAAAIRADWQVAIDGFARPRSAFVVSRGPGFAIAAEAALKFKETCLLHAEAFSAAELRHGPLALAEDRLAALVFQPRDAAAAGVRNAVQQLRAADVAVFVAGGGDGDLIIPPARHPLLDPIAGIAAFYGFVERLARARGHDPDRPPHLTKVTRTL